MKFQYLFAYKSGKNPVCIRYVDGWSEPLFDLLIDKAFEIKPASQHYFDRAIDVTGVQVTCYTLDETINDFYIE